MTNLLKIVVWVGCGRVVLVFVMVWGGAAFSYQGKLKNKNEKKKIVLVSSALPTHPYLVFVFLAVLAALLIPWLLSDLLRCRLL